MAINWGSLIFGGVDSSEYGIYLSGEGVYNAPERAVEVVDVPGRNGSVIIDQGHWNNIEVVYRAGVFGVDQAGFSEKLSAFRNAILSQTGYQRLSDSYHPEEFRMGAYVSGLEVSPASYNRHGEFELIFNCKPQRWLVDGDLPIPLDSGDVLENPTQYESSPLLEITGYGNVNFNNRQIALDQGYLGQVELLPAYNSGIVSSQRSFSRTYNLNADLFNTGDPITVSRHIADAVYHLRASSVTPPILTSVTTSQSGDVTSTLDYLQATLGDGNINAKVTFPGVLFTAGTPGTKSCTATFAATGPNAHLTITISVWVTYSITNGVHSITRAMSSNVTSYSHTTDFHFIISNAGRVSVDSTISRLGNPTYVDCDLGECYKIVDDDYFPLNQYIDLGSDLPTLAPGLNKITFDNTITDLKIAPRWWKL